jgi:hypothetical protein
MAAQRRKIFRRLLLWGHDGPAGAFAQEYSVMRNTLSDNKLYGHKKASQDCISDLTVLKKKPENPFNKADGTAKTLKPYLSV